MPKNSGIGETEVERIKDQKAQRRSDKGPGSHRKLTAELSLKGGLSDSIPVLFPLSVSPHPEGLASRSSLNLAGVAGGSTQQVAQGLQAPHVWMTVAHLHAHRALGLHLAMRGNKQQAPLLVTNTSGLFGQLGSYVGRNWGALGLPADKRGLGSNSLKSSFQLSPVPWTFLPGVTLSPLPCSPYR